LLQSSDGLIGRKTLDDGTYLCARLGGLEPTNRGEMPVIGGRIGFG
jgi:hypothetical protein